MSCGLYVHIPFCVRKCKYCDFCSVGIGDGDEILTGRMVDCLIRELEEYGRSGQVPGSAVKDEIQADRVDTIFIGGGTPSVLPVRQMERLLGAIREYIDGSRWEVTEFSVECNPGTVDEEKLRLFRAFGVNRLSFGLQSVHEEELKALGRIHTYQEFRESYELARQLGFDNINIDIMTAIPGQTTESLRHTLEELTRLKPEHISAYSLIIEEGTPFYDRYHEKPPIDEETDRRFFDLTHEMLTVAGYDHYEVSNYADKSDHRCRHNLNYWRRGNYIGIGPAASSHRNGVRKTNTCDLKEYMRRIEVCETPAIETEELSRDQQLLEAVYLGLRTSEGVYFSALQKEFGLDARALWRDKIEAYTAKGYMVTGEDHIMLTPAGWWISDYLITELLA